MEIVAAIVFGLALLHTFSAPFFEKLAPQYPAHAGILHLLGTIELVFALWAFVLIGLIITLAGPSHALQYATTRQYTEPLFVCVMMVVAATQPILNVVESLIKTTANLLPVNSSLTQTWLSLALVPLFGSFITEPAAMTIGALVLAPLAFNKNLPEWFKYGALATLFVNVSIGGTLTSYAAPPVLMVAKTWGWNSAFMAYTFGWKAVIAVALNASLVTFLLRSNFLQLNSIQGKADNQTTLDTTTRASHPRKMPLLISLVHISFLAAIVYFAHHPLIFTGLFLLFLMFTQAYKQYQSAILLKEGLMIGLLLAGLVVLGGMQQWWLQAVITSLTPNQLFFSATALTAVIDNAALTYLGAQVHGLSDAAKYMLMAGAVTGGGLTIIANAPNPAGATLLKHTFEGGNINGGLLLLAAIPPTVIAGILFFL